MSDNGNNNQEHMLSQDEIDALLNQGDPDEHSQEHGNEQVSEQAMRSRVDNYLTSQQQDTIGEIGNISFGSSSTTLSTLLNQKVDITTPSLSIVKTDELKDEFPKPHIAVHVKYTEGFKGINLLVIQMEDAKIIADLMLGGDGTSPDTELNEMHISAIEEAMNQMMGTAATSMSTVFNERIDISPPHVDILNVQEDEHNHPLTEEDILLKVSFRMQIGTLIDSHIMQLIPIPFSKEMVEKLLSPAQEKEKDISAEKPDNSVEQASEKTPHMSKTGEQVVNKSRSSVDASQTSSPSAGGVASHSTQSRSVQQENTRSVQPVQFTHFDQDETPEDGNANLDLLMDIPLQVTVELGRTKRVIKDILDLAPGSIIELDKLAGEPVDILVNNKLIAKGEVVVIEENFGVRVTDIVSQIDRLQKYNNYSVAGGMSHDQSINCR